MITDEDFAALYVGWVEAHDVWDGTGKHQWDTPEYESYLAATQVYLDARAVVRTYGLESRFSHLVKDIYIAELECLHWIHSLSQLARYYEDGDLNATPDGAAWVAENRRLIHAQSLAHERLRNALTEFHTVSQAKRLDKR